MQNGDCISQKDDEKKKEDSVNHDADIVKHVERFRELNRLNEAVVSCLHNEEHLLPPLQGLRYLRGKGFRKG